MSAKMKDPPNRPGLRDRLTEALTLLLPETRSTLAALSDAPTSVAQAVIQLLPFGSRSVLEDLEIVKRGPTVDGKGRTSLELTPFGFDVIDAAAKLEDSDPEGLRELVDNWDAAVVGQQPG